MLMELASFYLLIRATYKRSRASAGLVHTIQSRHLHDVGQLITAYVRQVACRMQERLRYRGDSGSLATRGADDREQLTLAWLGFSLFNSRLDISTDGRAHFADIHSFILPFLFAVMDSNLSLRMQRTLIDLDKTTTSSWTWQAAEDSIDLSSAKNEVIRRELLECFQLVAKDHITEEVCGIFDAESLCLT